MDLLSIIFILMLGLLVSNIVGHYIPFIPMALTQIAFGLIFALVLRDYSFEIGAEWFMLLFVAPLLYNDGRRFSREELWEMRAPIFGNAFVLVILTTVLCGYVINRLIPSIPLAAALALAAILSPTDPVAVNGIAKRVRIPEKVMVLVRGESLINDASGLVAFKYAIAAAVTGYFSLREAALDFTYTFLIGAVAGILLGLFITFVHFKLRKSGINDPVFHTLLQILTPFAVFFLTEHYLHASGVIAVVAAGILHSIVREYTATYLAEEQLLTENTWSIVLFVLNGFVFLLLGMAIPTAMFKIIADPDIGKWQALGYVVVICFVIFAVRFVWSLVSKTYYYLTEKSAEKPQIRTALTTTLAGVRGAVTMAGVLTVPFVLGNGEPFPARSLIIFIAAGVILLSLILATVFLPLLCRKEACTGDNEECADLTWAKNKLLLAAIRTIKAETTAENELAASELINEYTVSFRRNLSKKSAERDAKLYNRKLNEARLLAIDLQRNYIKNLLAKGEIDPMAFNTLTRLLDYREETLDYSFPFGTMLFLKRAMRDFAHLRRNRRDDGDIGSDSLEFIRDIRMQAISEAITSLEEYAKTQEQPDFVYAVILEYEKRLQRLKRLGDYSSEKLDEQKEELRFKVLDAERFEIRRMYEAGEISAEQEKELRRFVNHIEGIVLYEPGE